LGVLRGGAGPVADGSGTPPPSLCCLCGTHPPSSFLPRPLPPLPPLPPLNPSSPLPSSRSFPCTHLARRSRSGAPCPRACPLTWWTAFPPPCYGRPPWACPPPRSSCGRSSTPGAPWPCPAPACPATSPSRTWSRCWAPWWASTGCCCRTRPCAPITSTVGGGMCGCRRGRGLPPPPPPLPAPRFGRLPTLLALRASRGLSCFFFLLGLLLPALVDLHPSNLFP
jgi:hypothetical protein